MANDKQQADFAYIANAYEFETLYAKSEFPAYGFRELKCNSRNKTYRRHVNRRQKRKTHSHKV